MGRRLDIERANVDPNVTTKVFQDREGSFRGTFSFMEGEDTHFYDMTFGSIREGESAAETLAFLLEAVWKVHETIQDGY